MPAPLTVDWEAIKLSACAGVDYRTIAIQFGMVSIDGKPSTDAIRKRAEREQWPVPSRIKESARRQYKAAVAAQHAHKVAAGLVNHEQDTVNGQKVSTIESNGQKVSVEGVTGVREGFFTPSSGEIATVTVTNDLLLNGQRGTLEAQKIALRSILQAGDSLPVASVGDLQTALKVVRLAAGMDTQDSTRLSISLLGGNASLPDVESIDVEMVSCHDVTEDEAGD